MIKLEKEKIIQDYVKGKTLKEITKKWEIHDYQLYKILKKHGIKKNRIRFYSNEEVKLMILLYEKGMTETPLGNGVFLQLPREAISDVHWDEFAEPLTSPDEFEAFRRSSQRASKKEPLDVYGKKQSETMQVSTNKSKSFGDMLKSKLTIGM